MTKWAEATWSDITSFCLSVQELKDENIIYSNHDNFIELGGVKPDFILWED